MSVSLGIDTSNYTTSVSAFDGKKMIFRKKLLPVKEGENKSEILILKVII